MNWLTSFVKPKIQALIQRQEVPDHLWTQCPSCERMLFHRDLVTQHHVCQYCQYHFRLDYSDRFALLMDAHQLFPLENSPTLMDPLRFKDTKKYVDRLKEYRQKTQQNDAFIVATGTMGTLPVVVGILDFNFMGGSMGMAVGNGFLEAIQEAIRRRAPFIVVTASGGARMQEGMFSLMQMPRTIIGVQQLKQNHLPYITILTHPTTGGVSASFAMLGDVTLAEPGAVIGFAGARVIEETIRQKLPANFQTAEYLYEHGMVDCVVPRAQLKTTVQTILGHLCHSRG